MISQILIFSLMLDAAWVAYGLLRRRDRWAAIVCYWCILTVKNFVDWMGVR